LLNVLAGGSKKGDKAVAISGDKADKAEKDTAVRREKLRLQELVRKKVRPALLWNLKPG